MNYKEAHKTILRAVVDHIGLYKGGPEYFAALDEWVRTSGNLQHFILLLLPTKFREKNIIVSGRFGRAFANMCQRENLTFKRLIVLNGDLRGLNPKPDNLDYLGGLADQEFYFLDDSYYSGKTYRQVDLALRRQGASVEWFNVIYDGSRLNHDNSSSLFRYYDWEDRE